MTIVEPIPDTQWGRGNWTDYVNNWREKDAEYLQARSILRYHNATDRTADWASPAYGQITYNETAVQVGPGVFVDRPEMFSKQHNKWVALLMLDNVTSTQDNASGVALSHKDAAGKGVVFGPGSPAGTGLLAITAPLNVLNGIMLVDGTGVTIKTGARAAKLTTDAANLVSDTAISAPALISGGALSVAGAISAASITVTGTATLPNISMSGQLTGGVLNGTSGTIGGVAMGTAGAHGSGGVRADAQGFHAQNGAFYGDGSSAVLRQRNPSSGAYSVNYLQVTTDRVNVGGSTGYMDVYPTFRLFGGRGIQWINAGGAHQAWISPVIVQAGDPGAGNFPDGTIWIQP